MFRDCKQFFLLWTSVFCLLLSTLKIDPRPVSISLTASPCSQTEAEDVFVYGLQKWCTKGIFVFATIVSKWIMFSGSFSSTSHSTINYDIFLVQYLHQSTAHLPLPIFLHSKKNSFKDLKKVIIQSYIWNCQGKNCTMKYVCSCLPEVHNIHLWWWNWNNGRKIRHISVPSQLLLLLTQKWVFKKMSLFPIITNLASF